MKKKILYIILIIAFIGGLILVNTIINKENEKLISPQKENKEEYKMEVVKVTNKNFDEEVLRSEKKVLVDFYADWCGPCKMLSPIIEEIANENTDIKVVKINVDEAQDIAAKYNVMSIPTLVVIKNGEEVNKSVGFISKEQVLNLIK